ncbi:MAG TPA: ABC transporter permease [Candidatus Nanoarchaeia archaeon]|nr:ABC transporter permease [Candidatus Nanoarchaeia archaeon]
MRIQDLFEESYSALIGNKVRTGLTILGIVIGIGSVIAMVAIGQGSQNSIQASIQSIGSNLLIVTPGVQRSFGAGVSAGRGSAQTLTQADADALKAQLTQTDGVSPELSRRYQVAAKGTNTNTSVFGVSADYAIVHNVSVDSGSFISAENVDSSAKVAVLGPTAKADLFGTSTDPIGQTIRINQLIFKVVGVTAAKGGTGFNNPDDYIYIPISTAEHYLAGATYVSQISVEADSANDMTAVQRQITDILLQRHNFSDPTQADFTVLNQSDIVSAASGVTNTLTALLASIAGISLVVGGIGIMNMMLTTVTERTREIGLRKAIGATRNNINSQFLTEAVMLTFSGGLLGIVLGWILSLLVTKFANIAAAISFSSVILAFGVSAAIGLIFGYYPARRASRLNPIEALRFE